LGGNPEDFAQYLIRNGEGNAREVWSKDCIFQPRLKRPRYRWENIPARGTKGKEFLMFGIPVQIQRRIRFHFQGT